MDTFEEPVEPPKRWKGIFIVARDLAVEHGYVTSTMLAEECLNRGVFTEERDYPTQKKASAWLCRFHKWDLFSKSGKIQRPPGEKGRCQRTYLINEYALTKEVHV